MELSQRLTFHLILAAFYVYSLVYDVIYIEIGWQGYGGKFKYLTFLSLIIQTVYFGLAALDDVKALNKTGKDGRKTGLQKFLDTSLASRRIIQTVYFGLAALDDVKALNKTSKDGRKTGLQKFLDTSLASVVYPVGTFVVMTFWGIYAVDRELVYPKRLDKIIPQWLNHVMHTTVFPILVAEKYLVHREYPSRKKGLTIMLSFALAYLIWILWIAYYADIWVYPILQVMEAHQRALFIAILLAFFASIYILGESLNKFFWRKSVAAPTRNTRQKSRLKKTS